MAAYGPWLFAATAATCKGVEGANDVPENIENVRITGYRRRAPALCQWIARTFAMPVDVQVGWTSDFMVVEGSRGCWATCPLELGKHITGWVVDSVSEALLAKPSEGTDFLRTPQAGPLYSVGEGGGGNSIKIIEKSLSILSIRYMSVIKPAVTAAKAQFSGISVAFLRTP